MIVPTSRDEIAVNRLRIFGRRGSKLGSSLFGGLRSSTFRPSIPLIISVTRGPSLLFGISSSALPAWDQKDDAVFLTMRRCGRLPMQQQLDLIVLDARHDSCNTNAVVTARVMAMATR